MIDHSRVIFDRLLGREEKEPDDEPHEGHLCDGKRKRDRKRHDKDRKEDRYRK